MEISRGFTQFLVYFLKKYGLATTRYRIQITTTVALILRLNGIKSVYRERCCPSVLFLPMRASSPKCRPVADEAKCFRVTEKPDWHFHLPRMLFSHSAPLRPRGPCLSPGERWQFEALTERVYPLFNLPQMLFSRSAPLRPRGPLLLPIVAKVSKSTLLSVKEGRSGALFFAFAFVQKTTHQLSSYLINKNNTLLTKKRDYYSSA